MNDPRKPAPIVVLDVETVRSEVEHVAKPGHEDRLPAPPHHRIVCAGLLALDGSTMCVRYRDDGTPGLSLAGGPDATEMQILAALRHVDRSGARWVTFNGRGFDWGVITARALRYRMVWPGLFQRRLTSRYDADGHLDLMDALCWHGASAWPSADAIARSIGMPGKGEVSGADVQRLVDEGRLDDVQRYVLEDVVNEAGIAMAQALVGGFFGYLDKEAQALEGYRKAAQSLIDLVNGDERLRGMRGRMNEGLFLAEGS